MSRLLCCVCRPTQPAMGAAISQPAERPPPTMAIVIRERKKKAGGAALGTLRRRIAAATRRPNNRPDRECEHARFIRSIVANWRLAEVWLLCDQLEALNACRDLHTQAELAREPAASLGAALWAARASRVCVDVDVQLGEGDGEYTLPAHAPLLAARSKLFQRAIAKMPPNSRRITLQGPAAHLSLQEMEAALQAIYSGTDNGGTTRSCTGSCYTGPITALLGISPLAPHHHMRYLLESREYADTRLVWSSGQELPCHRFVLAARSRFFRGVLTRREGAGVSAGGAVCVDDKVLPYRFARPLLLAAYTDQVDLSLIGRPSSPTNSNGSSLPSSPWSSGTRGSSNSSQTLDDAFQLYEIARFLEMPIAVQGCEDAIVEALTHDTLPRVLTWSAQSHASQWVHRQAMRYLRDEFPSVMASASGALIPRAALSEALSSPFLQASEAQALRALIRWGSLQRPAHTHTEPNVVWHTAHSWTARGGGAAGGRGSRRRREVSDASLRDLLGPLLGLVRVEHLPAHTDVLHQAIRRGIIPEDQVGEGGGSAGAWLGRGVGRRPARCFLPYLDELRALLAEQQPPPELARLRRAPQPALAARIPDTLYMVAAARGTEAPVAEGEAACVSPRVLAALRARVRELRAAPPAARAASLPAADPQAIHTQIALRAVRERSLPDACADLLPAPDPHTLAHTHAHTHTAHTDRAGSGSYESSIEGARADLCVPSPSPSPSPSPVASNTNIHKESSRSSSAGTCRREQHRASGGEGGRLSARVPDVAMGPNANTHLLTHRDYHPHPLAHRHPPPDPRPRPHPLQLDLGDGATHAPAPGSRALRAHVRHREYNQSACLLDRLDDRSEDELRAALELSVIRAYSGMGWSGGGGGGDGGCSSASLRRTPPHPLSHPPTHPAHTHTHTLPHCPRVDVHTPYGQGASPPLRASPAPPAHPPYRTDHVGQLGVSAPSPRGRRAAYRLEYRLDTGTMDRGGGGGGGGGGGSGEERRSPLPLPRPQPSASSSPRDYA